MIVAIDGPAASGKSTVARRLAERFGLAYLDTGAMYRAIGVEALRRGIDLDDAEALTALACDARIEFRHDDGAALPTGVSIEGRDVTAAIRTPAADAAVSPVAAVPGVRRAMVEQQRRIAASKPATVLEGRDIGTVVFPDADVKVFLTASAEERARRRALDMERRGVDMSVEEVRRQDRAPGHDRLDARSLAADARGGRGGDRHDGHDHRRGRLRHRTAHRGEARVREPRPPRSFWFAHVVRATVGVAVPALFRTRLLHRERVPRSGGVILAGNHVSYADPILLWCRSPRPTHFMAKRELWGTWILGWGLDHFWAFRGAARHRRPGRAAHGRLLPEGG